MENEEEKKTEGYGKRPMWQWIALYAVVAVVAYGLFYYFVLAKNGNSNPYNQTGTNQNQTPTTAEQTPSTGATASEKITIEGNEFAFTPSQITLKKGQSTEITFKNTGNFPHNLDIADLGAKSKTIQPGQEDTFTVTPDKTGSFSFTCTVDSHAEKGMTGNLTVE